MKKDKNIGIGLGLLFNNIAIGVGLGLICRIVRSLNNRGGRN